MHKCRELSKLRKAKSIKSINYRHTTPGSITNVLSWSSPSGHKNTGIVDTSHPAAKLPKAAYNTVFPKFNSPSLSIKVFPKALLARSDVVWPNPPFQAPDEVNWVTQLDLLRETSSRKSSDLRRDTDAEMVKMDYVDMSMACIVGKKALHKSSVIRKQTVRRIKNAMTLIVSRGADVRADDKASGSLHIVFDDNMGSNSLRWILKDWTYILIPSLPMYRMPYPEMVSLLRRALSNIYKNAKRMEEQWLSEANAAELRENAVVGVKVERARVMRGYHEREENAMRREAVPPYSHTNTRDDAPTQTRTISRTKAEQEDNFASKVLLSPYRRSMSPAPPASTTLPSPPRLRISKTPFGLRPPPEEPSSETMQAPTTPTGQNTQASIAPATSSSLPIPRLFFPSSARTLPNLTARSSQFTPLESQSRQIPVPVAHPRVIGGSVKDKLFQKQDIFKIPHGKKLPGR